MNHPHDYNPGDDALLHDRHGRTMAATVIEVIAGRCHVPRVWVYLPALDTCQKVSLNDLKPLT